MRKVHPRLTPYTCALPDLPVDEIKKVLGKDKVYKLSFNENPLGPSPLAIEAMMKAITRVNYYPSSAGDELRHKIAEIEGVSAEQVILSNGADDMIILLAQTFLEPEDEVIIPKVTFVQYLAAANLMGARPVFSEMLPNLQINLQDILRKITTRTKIIFLCNPNNPTGTILSKQELREFISQVPEDVLVVIDEAYHEYAVSPEYATSVGLGNGRWVFTIRTFSKIYSLAGARLGYGIGPKELVEAVHSVRPPFNVNGPAQAGALAGLSDIEHLERARELNQRGKEMMYQAFESLGLPYLKSQGNFVYVDTGLDSEELFNRLLDYGVVVRTLRGYDLNTSLRVSVGSEEEVSAFVDALEKIISS